MNNTIPEGDLSYFLRIVVIFTDNYYEYEVPLKMSDPMNWKHEE